MPPILQDGFRLFFFLAALHAGLAIPFWLLAYFWRLEIAGPFGALQLHAHEMVFGYLYAVVAGFILTAIPNWTGRLPLSGMPLALLVALWVAGRLACLFVSMPEVAMAIDLGFPAMLCFAVWREVAAGRNWKNAPVAVMITVFAMANLLDHAVNLGLAPEGLGMRVALAAIYMLMALIGGRIVPSFTRNWLVKQGGTRLPTSFGRLDKMALAATALSAASWVTYPGSPASGALLVVAAVLLLARLARWRGLRTVGEPILFILHIGYAWLGLSLALLGVSVFTSALPENAALHALTAGAIGTMTLAVMTRASLGHTGRSIVADAAVMAIYALVTAGAVLRVVAPLVGSWYGPALAWGGAFWSAAFLLFALRYTPILWGRRANA
ncbi:NnrS family protein [Aminobacter aganoensis]|uniref:Uncharacterized protein involved in response to NO n=1 Tax=Aminobacter aganoensis TaxID=83264 RepID=A0A7X0KMA8_9HYPH|nr:NnrS family protein [Aminobacter aganoensis]MBB6355844.1 uncharacterized protein involved in response to NO [Aminobacter aganoensis]